MTSMYLTPKQLENGIRHPNFFNGRVLTAEDLRALQSAFIKQVDTLGQAVGDGVAYGFFVSSVDNGHKLRVTAGLAVNRLGDALPMPATVDLALVGVAPDASSDSPFRVCAPAGTTLTGGAPAGFYVLVVTRATGLSSDRAPTTSLNGTNVDCIARYELEGVQFKLVTLPFTPAAGTPDTRLRSDLAAACLGTPEQQAMLPNALSFPKRYGLIDQLRRDGVLQDCDVPLAALRWYNTSVQFVDLWAVRRDVTPPSGLGAFPPAATPNALDEGFSQHASDRRRREAEAFFLQFQAQLEDLRLGSTNPSNVLAEAHFGFLPAAGYLPIATETRAGYRWQSFFGTPPPAAPIDFDVAYVRDALHRSFYVEPVPVTAGQPVEVELFNLPGADAAQPFVLFLRRQQVIAAPAPEPEPPVEEPPPDTPAKRAPLLVLVLSPTGAIVPGEEVVDVLATHQTTSQAFHAERSSHWTSYEVPDFLALSLREAERNLSDEDRKELEGLLEPGTKFTPSTFIFRSLPVGRYTVRAKSRHFGLKSDQAIVLANRTNILVMRLGKRGGETKGPRDPRHFFETDEGFVTGSGVNIKKIELHERWRKPPLPSWPPEEWKYRLPEEMERYVEDSFDEMTFDSPDIVSTGVEFFIRPDYKAGTQYDEPYAAFRTKDGATFPVVTVPASEALAGGVPASRGGLADLQDASIETRARENGLGDLDVMANAWTGLRSEVLGLGTAGARALGSDARAAVDTLQDSFQRFPGVDAGAATALSAVFSDDVALSNATADQILAALNAGGPAYNLGFSQRLLDRVRVATPAAAWSLDVLGLSRNEVSALEGRGIDSLGALQTHLNDARGALNLDAAAGNELGARAEASMAGGRLRALRDPGVAGVAGVTDTRARDLAAGGIGTARALANADEQAVALTLGVTATEARTLITSARTSVGAATTAEALPGITAARATALGNVGTFSVGDVARMPAGRLATVLGINEAEAGDIQLGALRALEHGGLGG